MSIHAPHGMPLLKLLGTAAAMGIFLLGCHKKNGWEPDDGDAPRSGNPYDVDADFRGSLGIQLFGEGIARDYRSGVEVVLQNTEVNCSAKDAFSGNADRFRLYLHASEMSDTEWTGEAELCFKSDVPYNTRGYTCFHDGFFDLFMSLEELEYNGDTYWSTRQASAMEGEEGEVSFTVPYCEAG